MGIFGWGSRWVAGGAPGLGFLCGLFHEVKSTVFTSSLVFAAGCGVTLPLPLSKGLGDADVEFTRASVDDGGCGDTGDGEGFCCGCCTSAALSGCGGDFGSGGTDSLEGDEGFALTSAVELTSGERRRGELRRGGGVGECQRRSREAIDKD